MSESLVGATFGRWVVLARLSTGQLECRCACGKLSRQWPYILKSGRSRSCFKCRPAWNKGLGAQQFDTRTYKSWLAMRHRCGQPRGRNWDRYGGRGISVCQRWQEYANFHADMGDRPPGKTLDRIDCNGNYEPANCRWADHFTQNQNTRAVRRLTIDGVTLVVAEWARRKGIKEDTLRSRLRSGWPEALLFRRPSRGRRIPRDSHAKGAMYEQLEP